MDGEVIYFPPELAFYFDVVIFLRIFFPICTLIWRVNMYVWQQEKVWKGEMKVQKTQVFFVKLGCVAINFEY